ncbi:MarR family winged helix-turn-helix transcriptional regulator [Rhodococcus coprophilus]|uniref:MarR family transcriptional regulator n=1 Tax=Rhodococcus coprophilus TaxID=38310 RepID=A0A2X4U0K2_9NOCA|nr:MarR family transcriptional regulator [Rhodococcus coprophilus]MBM7458727.1 DNA-binding MarR family transcriptional regulator [Rhodococcus coprophilus]SQI33297.1 MarR family transcriptional regulator [Rhodococcus coprophilus]
MTPPTGNNRFDDEDLHGLRIAVGRIARNVGRSAADEGLTRSQSLLLTTVARHETIGVRELAEFEGLNPTMCSRMVGKLEEAGLVTRSSDADDKRVVRIHITAAGARLSDQLRARRTAMFARHLGELDDDRLDALHDALPALEALGELMCRSREVRE